MKKWGFVCLLLTAVLCLVLFAAPEAKAATSGFYTYFVYDVEATITRVDKAISGSITIPSQLGGYPVTQISSCAFENCRNLTAVTFPDTLTYIGVESFLGCENLADIYVTDVTA